MGNFPFPFTRFTDDGVGLHIRFPNQHLGRYGGTPISYSGHPRLKHQTMHKLFWVRVFVLLRSIAMQLRYGTSDLATIASYYVISNSFFTVYPTLSDVIIWTTDSVIQGFTNPGRPYD